ncbi:MAG: LysE family translocator [Pseudomonadota bacterium]
MFDYSLLHWTTFFTAVVLLELSPGADMAYMLGQTIRNGRKAGFAALFGSLVATYFHIAMAAIGLSAIIATSALAFSIVKWVGVIYLVWLGIQAFKSSDAASANEEISEATTRSVFFQGMLICALNPKVAIFFLAFLPQFVVEGEGPVSLQLLLHGTLLVVVALLLHPPLILMGSKIATTLKGNQNLRTWMDRCLGTLFIALGIRLAANKMN